MDTTETPSDETKVVDTDVAKSKTKAFFTRHKTKFIATGIAGLGAVSFLAGRASKDVVEDIDVVVTTPDNSEDSSS